MPIKKKNRPGPARTSGSIPLPPGHYWDEVDIGASAVGFECVQCGGTFEHDLMDGSTQYEPGDGSCDDLGLRKRFLSRSK